MIILFILVKLEVLVVVGVGVVLTVGGSDGDDYIQYIPSNDQTLFFSLSPPPPRFS